MIAGGCPALLYSRCPVAASITAQKTVVITRAGQQGRESVQGGQDMARSVVFQQ